MLAFITIRDVEPPLVLVWEEVRDHPRKRTAGPGDDRSQVALLRGAAAKLQTTSMDVLTQNSAPVQREN